MTWGVIAFEFGVGFALFVPRLRKPAMLLALSFHVANWVLLSIPEFMVCVTVYPLFLDPEELRAFRAGPGRAPSSPRSPLPVPGSPRFAGQS